jgi:single-stranded-DNA-specific exonuclease
MSRLPETRWSFYPQQKNELIQAIAKDNNISSLVAQVLVNRNIVSVGSAKVFLKPNDPSIATPDPLLEFGDLKKSIDILEIVIKKGGKIAVCGDYDADGMTSTALLLRAFRYLGALIDYAIPDRGSDGYGLNNRIVEKFAGQGVELIITVDNGIAAHQAVARAKELGLKIIITDHHDLPAVLPQADAILNPKLLDENCNFCGLAGVGVAYVLAISTIDRFKRLNREIIATLLELFTLGTIADLAPLVGINRRLLKKGLRLLPISKTPGIQALMQVSGLSQKLLILEPEDIGFKLGPRINAVGRIGDPPAVIELLTTDDAGIALERAMQCEAYNKQRQELCKTIEQEALELLHNIPWQEDRVIFLVGEHHRWHHGVIGLVASRLVERYGAPTFIATTDSTGNTIRGSARGIPEFNVYEALNFSQEALEKYGGHPAAGGFSLSIENLDIFKQKLRQFAHQSVEPEQLKPSVKIDALVDFSDLTQELHLTLNSMNPWGIGNDFPIFWTPAVRVLEQKTLGKDHLDLKLMQSGSDIVFNGKAWRWGSYCPIPLLLDIAYKLEENKWQGKSQLQLNIISAKIHQSKC